jgi:hypothetical protein
MIGLVDRPIVGTVIGSVVRSVIGYVPASVVRAVWKRIGSAGILHSETLLLWFRQLRQTAKNRSITLRLYLKELYIIKYYWVLVKFWSSGV